MRNTLALLLSVCLLAVVGSAFGAESTAPPPGEALPPASSQSIVTMVISVVVVPFLVRFLKAKSEESAKASEGHTIDMNKSLIEQKGILIERVKSYLFRRAGDLVESEFPRLAAAVVAGQMKTPEQIKSWLYAIGRELRGEAVAYFAEQGVDIVATFGQKAIDDLIESAANKVSPFPGMETAVAILKDGVAPLLLQRGIEYIRQNAGYIHFPPGPGGTAVGADFPQKDPNAAPIVPVPGSPYPADARVNGQLLSSQPVALAGAAAPVGG